MFHLIFVLALAGVVAYLILNFVPMPQPFKIAIIAIIVICVIYYLMNALGIGDLPLPRMR